MKGDQVAVCDMTWIDLRSEVVKILDMYFSYNQKMKDEKKK